MAEDETRRREVKRARAAARGNTVNGYDEMMSRVDRAAWKGLKVGVKWSVLGSFRLGWFAVASVRSIKAQRAHDDLIARRARRIGWYGKD